MHDQKTVKPLVAAGAVLGVGLGGFADGVVLHQILQAHAMLSARIPPHAMESMRVNMRADGVFHAVVWVVTLAGVFMLFDAGRRTDVLFSRRVLIGAMLMGWGGFNVVEGVIDHHLLGLHHVVERLGLSVWDWLFLAVSGVMIVAGRRMTRMPRPPE